jgi:hypothetical protein
MREQINIREAVRLYRILRTWREVADRMIRKNGMKFTHDAVQAAVRRHDRRMA